MKKIITFLAVISVLFSVYIPTVSAASVAFSDVTDATQKQAVQKMVDKGYIKGYPDGTFRPNAPVLRSELVRMVNQVFQYTVAGQNVFVDVKSEQWFYQDVLLAQKMGYIVGFPDKTFRPNSYVTREQMCVILDNIMHFKLLTTDTKVTDSVSSWALDSVNKLLSNKIFSLEVGNTFRATKNITRGEVCVAISKFIVEEDNNTDTTSTNTGTSTNTSPGNGSSSGSNTSGNATLLFSMNRVIESLETKIIPNASTAKVKAVAQAVLDNMKAYKKDNTYDYKTAGKQVQAMYNALSSAEQEELKQLVMKNTFVDDLMTLYDFFTG